MVFSAFCLAPLQSATCKVHQSFHLSIQVNNGAFSLHSLLLNAQTSFLDFLYCTPQHYGLFFCYWSFSINSKGGGRIICFCIFPRRLLCLYVKFLNTVNLSSINGSRGWRKQKKRLQHGLKTLIQTVVMHSFNPRTEESKAGRLLWIPGWSGLFNIFSLNTVTHSKTLSENKKKQINVPITQFHCYSKYWVRSADFNLSIWWYF